MAHTKGPLTIERSRSWVGAHDPYRVVKTDGRSVALCPGPDAEANARLFAAAPQMLEALKDARENIATRFGADAANNLDADLIDKIDAAISAAEGQD